MTANPPSRVKAFFQVKRASCSGLTGGSPLAWATAVLRSAYRLGRPPGRSLSIPRDRVTDRLRSWSRTVAWVGPVTARGCR